GGGPTHPRRAPRSGTAAPPGGGRGDGQRHGDRRAARRGRPPARLVARAETSRRPTCPIPQTVARSGPGNDGTRSLVARDGWGGGAVSIGRSVPEAAASHGPTGRSARPAHPRLEEGRMRKALALLGGMMLLASAGSPAP